MRDDVKVEVTGFEKDVEITNLALSLAEKLQTSSPSDSVLKLVLRKGKGAVEASCRIASQVGTFFADSVSENPLRAIQEIESKIRVQLDNWKQRRFGNDATQMS